MITFDEIKLVADINSIKICDDTQFEKSIKDGVLSSMKYYQERPFLLKIKVDYECSEVVIEFCGKILGRDYPKLISIETIRQCFETINGLGFCKVNIEAMMQADVVKCDVTKDIPVSDTEIITNYIHSHISSYKRFHCRKLKNGNVVLEKNVTSSKLKKRMTIYDKEKEMQRSSNKLYTKENELEEAFCGKCRWELNLNTKEQIRRSLHINDTKLLTVLSSDSNPILDFLDEVVEQPCKPIEMTDYKSFQKLAVLQVCDNDLEKVEAKIRALNQSRGTSIPKMMKPYKALLEQIEKQIGDKDWNDLRQKLA